MEVMDMDQVYRQAELDDQADTAFGIDNGACSAIELAKPLGDEDAF